MKKPRTPKVPMSAKEVEALVEALRANKVRHFEGLGLKLVIDQTPTVRPRRDTYPAIGVGED
ncbi:MAG TPA: hypothetical protein VFV05_09520 [Methylomirabilota bacterium]|nr:hypothetical protein [Methylomirabilota bacterium]